MTITTGGRNVSHVIAVVPSYLPSAGLIEHLARLGSQVDAVIVVDDGSPSSAVSDAVLAEVPAPGRELIRLGSNRGIAHALNAGIRIAISRGAEYVLTLDQDTLLPLGYVDALVEAFERAATGPTRVGMIATEFVNGDRARPAAITDEGIPLVVEAIQSGSLLSAECLRECGLLDERLVIDTVDTEYCLRMSLRGFAVAIAPGSRIEHAIGTRSPVRVLGLPVRRRGEVLTYPYHGPYRRYFITRNNLDLWFRFARRRPTWTALSMRRELVTGVLTLLSGPDRSRQFLAIAVGGWHGLIRRRGPMPSRLRRTLLD
ncbi:glycosyltransferase [Agromyces sp. PvR057]|uniref:glycosyltransferase n=1 Tax=Agromyces sp. PvR057 TaxID=3156403 RepID=UPI000E231CCA